MTSNLINEEKIKFVYNEKSYENLNATQKEGAIIFGQDGSLHVNQKEFIPKDAKFTDTIPTPEEIVALFLKGAQGNQGLEGFQGVNGNRGIQGNQGSVGEQGKQGNQGKQGTAGGTGTTGNRGFQGNQGGVGEQGKQGNQGKQGGAGGTGTVGHRGFQGNQGGTGEQGKQGNQGKQGDAGGTGSDGNRGFQGNQGSPGAAGAFGRQGRQGNVGWPGDIGNQGSRGATGSQGFPGAQGGTGTNGVWGYMGIQGNPGIPGAGGTATLNIKNNATNSTQYYLLCTEGIRGTTISRAANSDNPNQYAYYKQGELYASSDIRSKENIKEIDNEFVDKLFNETENGLIYEFDWIDGKKHSIGTIAQIVEKYIPEVVSVEEDGKYAVSYNGLLSKLVGAIFKKVKQQQNEINELKQELSKLL